jgi:hypothetical protein
MKMLYLSLIPSLFASLAIGSEPPPDIEYTDPQSADLVEIGDEYPVDALAGAACSFTPFLDFATFDAGWAYGELSAAFVPSPSNLVVPTINGYQGSAPPGTSTLGIASTPALTSTFATWRKNLGVSLDADTIYRVQTTVTSDATLGESNWMRIRFGGDYYVENGQGELGYTSNASSLPREPRVQNLLHWVKSTSDNNSLPGEYDEPAMSFDLIDEDATVGGHMVAISGITIDSFSRECLGAGTVIRNKGVASVSSTDGWAPSGNGLTPFAPGDGYSIGNINDAGASVTMTSSTTSPLAGAMNITFSTVEAGDQNGFAALFVTGNPAESRVTIDNSKVYAMDLWISAPIAGNSTDSRLPSFRTRWIADQSVSHNHGQTQSTYYNLSPDNDFDELLDNSNGIDTANSARHYVAYWWPDLDTEAQPDTTSNFFVDFLYFRHGAWAIRPNGTFSIERLTITEYDQPTF